MLGNALMAFSYGVFTVQANLMTGGLGGIALLFDKLFKIDISLIILILSWLLFFIGWLFLGTKFALHTLFSTIFYPLFVLLFTKVPLFYETFQAVNNDYGLQIIYALVAAMLAGIGLGIVFKIGGSTGGVDILCWLISKKFKITLGVVVFIIDFIVIALGFFAFSWIEVVVGILSSFLASKIIDIVLLNGSTSIVVNVVSEEVEEINKFVIDVLERGSTFYLAKGGYTDNDKKVLQVVLNRREYPLLMGAIHKIDKTAFVTVLTTFKTLGNGFRDIANEK